jgi:CRISPR system Cascade subunit CasC
MKTLVELHVLQNFAPSNLNRDDTGAPKDALFGGTRRARVSSQCWKRAVREYFVSRIAADGMTADDLSVRTKRVHDALVGLLKDRGRDEATAKEKAKLALAAMELTVKDDGKTQYLLFLGQREVTSLAAIIDTYWESIGGETGSPPENRKPVKAKKLAASAANPELRKALDKVFDGGKALDVALFGRMLAENQYAACQVAHAISTHAVEREFDFYTAVDDLKPEDTAGADMIGTVEFNSACFYRYAVVDWQKLNENLQNDAELSDKGLRAFLEGFVVAEPTGKQNTFAAHNAPEFVAVTVRRNGAPRSLANAFETAIRVQRGESLTAKSAAGLVAKAQALQAAYGGDECTFMLDLTGTVARGYGTHVASLAALIDAAVAAAKE